MSAAMRRLAARIAVAALVAAGASVVCCAAGCIGSGQENGYTVRTGGSAERGRRTLVAYRCGACHTIPDVTGANGTVGPPLTSFGRRSFIGGELPNTPRNLVSWILSAHTLEPGVAMPAGAEMGLDEKQARDVAAYLYTLR